MDVTTVWTVDRVRIGGRVAGRVGADGAASLPARRGARAADGDGGERGRVAGVGAGLCVLLGGERGRVCGAGRDGSPEGKWLNKSHGLDISSGCIHQAIRRIARCFIHRLQWEVKPTYRPISTSVVAESSYASLVDVFFESNDLYAYGVGAYYELYVCVCVE